MNSLIRDVAAPLLAFSSAVAAVAAARAETAELAEPAGVAQAEAAGLMVAVQRGAGPAAGVAQAEPAGLAEPAGAAVVLRVSPCQAAALEKVDPFWVAPAPPVCSRRAAGAVATGCSVRWAAWVVCPGH